MSVACCWAVVASLAGRGWSTCSRGTRSARSLARSLLPPPCSPRHHGRQRSRDHPTRVAQSTSILREAIYHCTSITQPLLYYLLCCTRIHIQAEKSKRSILSHREKGFLSVWDCILVSWIRSKNDLVCDGKKTNLPYGSEGDKNQASRRPEEGEAVREEANAVQHPSKQEEVHRNKKQCS